MSNDNKYRLKFIGKKGIVEGSCKDCVFYHHDNDNDNLCSKPNKEKRICSDLFDDKYYIFIRNIDNILKEL